MERDTLSGEKLKALKLEPGGVYVVEVDAQQLHGPLSLERMANLRAALDLEELRLGVKFMVLQRGLTIAREAVNAA
jgi:hypothetical protein